MANPNKFTAKEVLNKVLLDSSGDAVTANSVTSQEALNSVLDTTNNRLNMSLAGGTISGDVTISGDLTVNGNGSGNYDEIVNGNLVVSSGNKLGVGTETPDFTLHVNGASDGDGYVKISDANTGEGGTDGARIGFNSGVMRIQNFENSDMEFYVNNSTKPLVLESDGDATFSGDVHISNSTPLLQLTDSDVSTNVTLDGSGGIVKLASHTGQTIRFLIGSTEVSRFDSSGNLGIGTNSPIAGSSKTILTISDSAQAVLVLEDTGYESSGDGLAMLAYNDGALAFRTASRSGTDFASSTTQLTLNESGTATFGGAITSGGNVTIPAGNLLYLDGGSNTYIYQESADKISFATNSGVRLSLDNNSRISLSNNSGSGTNNTLFGYLSGNDIASGGNNNAFFGHLAGTEITTGEKNTMLGAFAGYSSLLPDKCVLVGYNAGGSGVMTAGADATVAVGMNSLSNLTSGAGNTAVGFESQTGNTTGSYNTAIGHQSMLTHDGGLRNVAIGAFSMDDTDAGSVSKASDDCIFIGYNSGGGTWANQDCSNIVAIGSGTLTGALQGDTTDGTVAIGKEALTALTSGAHNLAIGHQALQGHTTGARNIAIGYGAMDGTDGATVKDSNDNIMIGKDAGGGTWTTAVSQYNIGIGTYVMDAAMNGASYNIGIGFSSLSALTQGDSNTALGQEALGSVTQGSRNVAIGFDAGKAMTTANRNMAIGYEALRTEDADGDRTTAIGYQALYSQNSGTEATGNTAVGYISGYYNVTGTNNTYMGYGSGGSGAGSTNSHDNNTAIGYKALEAVTTGSDNAILGTQAGDALLTGNKNIAIGRLSLSSAQDCDSVIAIGYAAINANLAASGDGSIAIGHAALNNHSSNLNIAIGFNAGKYVTSGGNNTAIGYASLGGNVTTNLTGNNNTCIGHQAGRDMQGGADGNVIVGRNAAVAMTTAANNTIIGTNAGDALVDETHNTAIGTDALGGSSLVDQAVVVGSQAGMGAMTASADGAVAVGYASLAALTSGAGSVSVGYQAGDAITSGDYNTAIGYQALSTEDTGDRNTAVGYQSLLNVNGANNNANTALGYLAGDGITTGTGNVCLGSETETSANSAQGQFVIGNNCSGTADFTATFGNGSNTASLGIDGSDTSWAAASSDKRLKENIETSLAGLGFINDLRPVTYNWKKAKDVDKSLPQYKDSDEPSFSVRQLSPQ